MVSAGSPAAERAWLISASTCAAAVPPWLVGELAGAVADAEGRALGGRGDGEREDADADGLAPAGRDGTDATTGGPPVARPAQVPVAAAPHPDVVAPGLAAACPDAEPAGSAPQATQRLPAASTSMPDSQNLPWGAEPAAFGIPPAMSAPPHKR
jgi:hypothetical protein